MEIFSQSFSEKEAYIENEFAGLWTFQGLMYIRYWNNVIIDLPAARKILDDRLALCNGKEYPVLNQCKGVRYWTKDAQAFQNSPENYKLYKAAAIIYYDNVLANVVVNFYIRFFSPLIPARFFKDEKTAFEWIMKYV